MKRIIAYIIFFLFTSSLTFSKGKETVIEDSIYIYDKDGVENRLKDLTLDNYIELAGSYSTKMKANEKFMCAIACAYIGEVYFEKESYPQAFDFYFKGLQICEENSFDRLSPRFYKNIGNIYSVFEDNLFAMDYYKKGLAICREYNLTEMKVKILINLLGICIYESKIEEAERYLNEMEQYKDKNRFVEYFTLMGNGMINVLNNNYSYAVTQFNSAAKYAVEQDLGPNYISSVYAELTHLYEKKETQDSVIFYAKKNYELCKANSLISMQVKSLKVLYSEYKKAGNRTMTDFYHDLYMSLSDSLSISENHNRIKNAQVTYELNKNYNKILELTYEQKAKDLQILQQKRAMLLILICLGFFIVLLVFLYIQKRKLSSAYKDLFRRNSDIIASERINKDIKNNLELKINRLESQNIELQAKIEHLQKEEKTIESVNQENQTAESIESTDNDSKQKTNNSNKLSDEQKRSIHNKILNAMEDTSLFCDSDFSLEKLASIIGSNSKYVSQIINETYNKNFRTFLNEYRIKEASIRLSDKEKYANYTIKAIGESLGYKSQANFIDSFKKITGITPSMFQRMVEEKDSLESQTE